MKLTKHDVAEIAGRRASTVKHLRMSIEDWRQKKRQEWGSVVRAVELFNFGCAYTPAGNDLYEIQKAMGRISEAMDEEWVCW